jgi:biotin carboxyl carrier protein
MLRHLRITVDGKPYDVVVEDVTEDTGSSIYPSPGTMAQASRVVSSAPAAAPAAPAAPAAGGGGTDDKLAPLGGVIVEINVKVGDSVTAGDKIATIEAMKMKTAVSAHKDGKVVAIPVKVGDPVDAGQVIMTIS